MTWSVRRQLPRLAAILLAVLGGCSASPKPVTYLGYSDLHYYKDVATKIDYPMHPASDECEALASDEPRRIRYPRKDEIWDLTLGEAIKIALRNNKIIRTRDQTQFPRNPLVTNPDQSPSVYDPAIQETGVLVGQRGVEAALSDFDAQFSTNMTWGYNSQIVNNAFAFGGLSAGGVVNQDTGTFRARLDKTFADSTQLSLINEWDYMANNEPGNLFPSSFTGFARVEMRRPLLAGGGAEYTRIAGPVGKQNFGVGQGVVISRINNDIAIADFEASVHGLVRDVQNSYWDLALAYRTFRAQVISFDSALKSWRLVNAKAREGIEGGSAADETQARDNYFDSKSREQDALANIYTTEGLFRRLLGLPVNDGRVIRPCDEPTVAEFIPDWHVAVAEGVTRRPEIRRQKWNIKSLEYQLIAAKNLVQPRVDFVAGYQLNAFGDVLISGQTNPTAPGSSAFASLVDTDRTAWNIGFEASIPIGYRKEHSQVRNNELRLQRAHAGLATEEIDIAHEIRQAFQSLDRYYALAKDMENRRQAAQERVDAYEAQYELKGSTVDPLLRAQQSLAQAEVAYYQYLIQYNQAITDFYYRTGTILDESNVTVAEDAWDPRANRDALREAWARSHAKPAPFLKTEPPEFVIPPGRPTSAIPMFGTVGSSTTPAASVSTPAPYEPDAPLISSPPTGAPAPETPRPESEPASPLPSPQPGPSGLPQATVPVPFSPQQIRQVSATYETFLPPVSVPVAQPGTANPPISSTQSVAPNGFVASGVSPPRRMPVPFATLQAPVSFQSPTSFQASAPKPDSASWSMPQGSSSVGPAGSTSSSDEIQSPKTDAYDMPLNQLGK